MTAKLPPLSVIEEYFFYDDLTGNLIWKTRPSRATKIGDIAGWETDTGYLRVSFKGKSYLIHRLIWKLVHKREPIHEIDHINGNKQDNRIENLRDVSRSRNQQNRRKAKGYYLNKGKYNARITVDKKQVHLGCFNTEFEARQAYLAAKKIYHR